MECVDFMQPRWPSRISTFNSIFCRWAYDKAWAVWTTRFAASQPAMPPAISLTRSNPLRSNKLAAMDDR